MTAAYGLGRYGLDAYGGAASGIAIAAAYAIDTHTVRVVLSSEPQALSQYRPGDALNPATWTVARLDTGAAFTVLATRRHAAATVDLDLLEALGSRFVTHTVATETLLSVGGLLVGIPREAQFLGVVEEHDPLRASAIDRFRERDVANPPFSDLGVSGTLEFASDGDLASDDGVELARKCIMRRMTTRPGAFKHLPNYGIGLVEQEPLPGGSPAQLRARIEQQVAQEPDVQAVSAVVSFAARDQTLTVDLSVVLTRTGATLDFGVAVRSGTLVEL